MSYAEYAAKQKGGEEAKDVKTEEEKIKSGEKYLKKSEKKEEFKKEPSENQKKKAKEIDDFFKILDDTHKNTFAYMYAANSLDAQLSKEFDNNGKKEENPMFGKIFKVTTYKFQFGRTYKEAVAKKNPDWEVQASKGKKEKVEGYEMVYFNEKGDLMFPLSDFTSTSKYYMKEDNGKVKEITLKDIQPYLKLSSSLRFTKSQENKGKNSSGSGVNYRNINVDKIYKLNAGGKTWSNKDFIYSALGSVIK